MPSYAQKQIAKFGAWAKVSKCFQKWHAFNLKPGYIFGQDEESHFVVIGQKYSDNHLIGYKVRRATISDSGYENVQGQISWSKISFVDRYSKAGRSIAKAEAEEQEYLIHQFVKTIIDPKSIENKCKKIEDRKVAADVRSFYNPPITTSGKFTRMHNMMIPSGSYDADSYEEQIIKTQKINRKAI